MDNKTHANSNCRLHLFIDRIEYASYDVRDESVSRNFGLASENIAIDMRTTARNGRLRRS